MEQDRYEQDTAESDKELKTHEDINPYRYIDQTMQRIGTSLTKQDMDSGVRQYIILINKLEYECQGINMITSEYFEKIRAFTEKDEYRKLSDKERMIKLATKKYGMLFKELCSARGDNSPLIVKRQKNEHE